MSKYDSWEDEVFHEANTRGAHVEWPKIEGIPPVVSLTMGRTDEVLYREGFCIRAQVDDTEACWSVPKAFGTFLKNQPLHKKQISNIQFVGPTQDEHNPRYHQFRFIMGDISWDEVLKKSHLWYKFSGLHSRKFDSDKINQLKTPQA